MNPLPLFVIAALTAAPAQESRPPNLVVIFTDDQGYGDLGCQGAEGFETPHLDQMADDGLRLTQFYVPATVCTPSRAALLTGCYPKRVGLHEAVLFPFSEHGLHPEEITLAELLKRHSYATGCIGKWHLGHHPDQLPRRHGFDTYFGIPYSNDMDGHEYKNPPFQAPPLPLYRDDQLIESGPDQNELTERFTQEAVAFIHENGDRPFFLYLAHPMPHLPLHASESFRGSSDRGLYGDVIQELDASVGRIREALAECGLTERTLVVFTSDNGPVRAKNRGSTGGLRGGKGTTWEGGQRVPALFCWPGTIPAGSTSTGIASTLDLLPTMASILDMDLADHPKIDGVDLSEWLRDPARSSSPRESLYYYARNGELEAMRLGRWKLHTEKSRGWNASDQGEFSLSLYDLDEDPGESENLASSHPEKVREMKELMETFDGRLSREAREAYRSEHTTGASGRR